jgi:hypothetical protein
MIDRRTAFSAKPWARAVSALALVLVSCGGGDPGSSSSAGSAATASSGSTIIETQIPGEQFTSLDVAPDSLSGVFVKGDQSLAFHAQQQNGASALRLTNAAGEELYSIVQTPAGVELSIGSTYHAVLPLSGAPGAAQRAYSPAGFSAEGDLRAALDALKSSAITLLPSVAAALGRVGLDGASAPAALSLHLTAERLTQELGLQLDPAVLAASNRIVAARAQSGQTSGGTVAHQNPSTPGELHTEGLMPGTPITCPRGRPPCAAGLSPATSGLFAGCCMPPPPPPPPDYSASCVSGQAREAFPALDGNPVNDPCHDDCLGMCGPGCSPWFWVCGDERVHVACWNHDRAYCPATFSGPWGIPIPNPDWPVCEAEYLAYTAEIGADTILGPLCSNDAISDLLTTPPFGLWTLVPDYYQTYR